MSYQTGETVNVTIRGALVRFETDREWLCLQIPGVDAVSVPLDSEAVTVERAIPAEGLPQSGDVWSDRNKRLWLAAQVGDEVRLSLGEGWLDTEHVSRKFGPLTLIVRDGLAVLSSAEPQQTAGGES